MYTQINLVSITQTQNIKEANTGDVGHVTTPYSSST